MKTVTAAEMKKIEKAANDGGLSYYDMMENAGCAAAAELLRARPELKSAAVFAGKGNNGGDAFVVARKLAEKNVAVMVELCEGEPETADAKTNLAKLRAMGVPVVEMGQTDLRQEMFLHMADAAVDGVYGTGFHGELRESGKRAAELINSMPFVLALDLPSGVAADTGETAEGAVRADLTVTFHAAKPCHISAAIQCGRIAVADIGIREK
jgi:NAD(P)H-hydrate epimerase